MNLITCRYFLSVNDKNPKLDPVARELKERDEWLSEHGYAIGRAEFYVQNLSNTQVERYANKLHEEHSQFTATQSPWNILRWRSHKSVSKAAESFIKKISRKANTKNKVHD